MSESDVGLAHSGSIRLRRTCRVHEDDDVTTPVSFRTRKLVRAPTETHGSVRASPTINLVRDGDARNACLLEEANIRTRYAEIYRAIRRSIGDRLNESSIADDSREAVMGSHKNRPERMRSSVITPSSDEKKGYFVSLVEASWPFPHPTIGGCP